jgi:tetratricopeptide (TPR) repeat protein
MFLTSIRVIAVVPAALLLQPVFGQQSGAPPQPAAPIAQPGAGATSPPPSATPTPEPTTVPPIRTLPPPSEPPPAIPQEHPEPIYVSGRVVSDDGQPFTDPVAIESVCDGISHAVGFAGRNGDFAFRLGDQNSGIVQDASASSMNDYFGSPNVLDGHTGNDTPTYITPKRLALAECEIRARLSGYRSDAIAVGNRRALDNPNVGTIVLRRIGPVEGQAISVTSLAAPKDSSTAFEKGRAALKKNKLDDARRDFERAAQIYPGYAAAWCELGKLAADHGQLDEGLRLFRKAIQADPKYADPYLRVSAILTVEKQWPQLAETTGALLRLAPYDYPQAYYMNAVANYNLRNFDAAEKSAREAERLDAQGRLPRIWQFLGTILANRGAFPEAAEQMRQYLKLAPQAPDAGAVRERLSRLEALSAAAGKMPSQ